MPPTITSLTRYTIPIQRITLYYELFKTICFMLHDRLIDAHSGLHYNRNIASALLSLTLKSDAV